MGVIAAGAARSGAATAAAAVAAAGLLRGAVFMRDRGKFSRITRRNRRPGAAVPRRACVSSLTKLRACFGERISGNFCSQSK
jgi:hypothetical protein